MEDHKNSSSKLHPFGIDKLKKLRMDSISPIVSTKEKHCNLAFQFFDTYLSNSKCVPFTLVAEVVVDSLPSDLSHPLATLTPKSPRYMAEVQCVECPAGCVIAENPPSRQAVEG